MPLPDLPDDRVLALLSDQLGRYDAIVTRLAGTGVQVKTWCVTTVGAVSALAVNGENSSLFAVGLAITGLFMVLDVFYLRLERRFRDGANRLVQRVANDEISHLGEFFITNRPPRESRWTSFAALVSPSILPFYSMTTILLVIGLLTT